MSVKPEKNITNFFLIFQKYFMKYFRAKKIMKFYITSYCIIAVHVSVCISNSTVGLNQQETQLSLTNLCDAFIGQSRSPNIVLIHMLDIVSYCAIVKRHAVFTIFDFKNVVTLKSGSEVTQGH